MTDHDPLALANQHAETLQGLVASAPDHASEAAVLGELARTEAAIGVARAQLDAARPLVYQPGPQASLPDEPAVTGPAWRDMAAGAQDAGALLHSLGGYFDTVPSERIDELLDAYVRRELELHDENARRL